MIDSDILKYIKIIDGYKRIYLHSEWNLEKLEIF